MQRYQAPSILLYNSKKQLFESLRDTHAMAEQFRSAIQTYLGRNDLEAEDMFLIKVQDHEYHVTVVSLGSDDYLFFIMQQIDIEMLLSIEMETTLRKQQQQLFELVKAKNITEDSIQAMLREICETVSTLVNCDCVSIWLINEERTTLQCMNVYERNTNNHRNHPDLEVHKLTRYFHEIQQNRSLAIDDVLTDDRSKELHQNYFPRMGKSRSVLDVPLILSTGIGGVLCCDSFEKKTWSELHKTITCLLADMVSFLIERMNRKKIEEKIMELAYLDPLTGLYNHHAFLEHVDRTMRELPANKKGYMMYLLLDQFDSIQDALGFGSGDQVLVTVAERLKQEIGDRGYLSRIGFGHFTIFIPDGDDFAIIQNKIKESLHLPMDIQKQDVYITHSYGVSIYPDHGQDAKQCIQMAQLALNYEKKSNARSVKAFFSKGMVNVIEDDLHAEMNLRKGLDLNEFELYYQPQADSYTGKTIGLEGLIRWNHPERGLIGPGEFIGLAESTGLIIPIGEWVITQAFTQLEQWKREGSEQLTISVNISPRHFLDPSLYQFLKTSLTNYDVNPSQLVIEITENVAMEDFGMVKRRIEELRILGFYVSIDDFGTGFSAFQYLQYFPVQEIKIDRQFIRDITTNEVSKGIAKTIIDLANILRLNVVSEGVETEEQWQLLKELGCPELQGFYFSKPKPLHELRPLLINENSDSSAR